MRRCFIFQLGRAHAAWDFGSRDAGRAALWRTAVSVDRGGAKILARSGITLSCLSTLGYLLARSIFYFKFYFTIYIT